MADSPQQACQLVLTDDSAALSAFLEFCYLGTYTSPADPYYDADTAKAAFEFHARIFAVADKFGVPALANLAEQNIVALLHGAEEHMGEEHADVWEWGVECVYLHGDVLNIVEEQEQVQISLTLRERLEQLKCQQASMLNIAVAADEVGRCRDARGRLKDVVVDAVVGVYRANENYRLLRRFARVARDTPEFGADVAAKVLYPGP
jgi:hypothetical protein